MANFNLSVRRGFFNTEGTEDTQSAQRRNGFLRALCVSSVPSVLR